MSEELLDVKMSTVMTLHRPTPMRNLIESVPKPDGWELKKGLPMWKLLPLGSKLPMINAPKGSILFTRGKLGQKLWKSSKGTEDFSLEDPYCRDVSYSYDALHDTHLQHWFEKEANKKPLLKQNLITKENDVPCSLKDYNEYRRYLNRLHNDSVNKEQTRKEYTNREVSRFRRIQKIALSDYERCYRRECLLANFYADTIRQNKKESRVTKKGKFRTGLKRVEYAYRRIMGQRAAERTALAMKGALKNVKIWNNIVASKEHERKRKIETLRKWKHNDEVKVKEIEQSINEKRRIKQQHDKERWNRKIANQSIHCQLEKEILLQYRRYFCINLGRRVKLFQRRHLEPEGDIQLLKRKIQVKIQRKSTKLSNIIVKRMKQNGVNHIGDEVHNTITRLNHNVDRYNQIQEVRRNFEIPNQGNRKDFSEAKMALRLHIEEAALNVILTYIEIHIQFIIHKIRQEFESLGIRETYKRMERLGRRKPADDLLTSNSADFDRRRSTVNYQVGKSDMDDVFDISYHLFRNQTSRRKSPDFSGKTSSKTGEDMPIPPLPIYVVDFKQKSCNERGPIFKGNYPRKYSSEETKKSVRIGKVTDIPSPSTVYNSELKSVKGRIPTPVPSVTHLAKLAFSEPLVNMMSSNQDGIPSDIQLECELAQFARIMYNLIIRRIVNINELGKLCPLLAKQSADRRKKREGKLNVSRGLTLLIMKSSAREIKVRELGPFADALGDYILNPERYPIPFVHRVSFIFEGGRLRYNEIPEGQEKYRLYFLDNFISERELITCTCDIRKLIMSVLNTTSGKSALKKKLGLAELVRRTQRN